MTLTNHFLELFTDKKKKTIEFTFFSSNNTRRDMSRVILHLEILVNGLIDKLKVRIFFFESVIVQALMTTTTKKKKKVLD